VDKRFGERDAMSEADKSNMRFHQERLRQSRNMFSIDAEESSLTHLGMRLGDSSTGANPLQDDLFFQVGEDEQFGGKGGLLDEQAVQALHFGGADGSANQDRKKTKREIMDEIVAKSKIHKAERRQENQEQMELLQEVDNKFREITHFLTLKKKPEKKVKLVEDDGADVGRVHEEGYEQDEYDMLVAELRTTSRDAKAGDRMQSKEEEAKMRLERMKTLELMRERRMQGISVGPEEELVETTAKPKIELADLKKLVAAGKGLRGDDEDEEDIDSDEDDDDDGENDDEHEDGDKSGTKSKRKLKRRLRAKLRGAVNKELRNRGDWVIQKRWKRDLLDDEVQARKDETESLRTLVDANTGEELPFVIAVPDTFEAFVALMRGNSVDVCGAILDRMLHSNDPLLDPANAGRLRQLHVYILGWALRGAGADDCSCLERNMYNWIEMAVGLIRRLVLMVPLPQKDVLTSPQSVFFAYRVLLNAVIGVDPVVPAKASSEQDVFAPLLPRLETAGRRRGAEARGADRVGYFMPDGCPAAPVMLTLLQLSRLFSASDKLHPIWSPVLAFLLSVLSSQTVRSFAQLQIMAMICDALLPVLTDARVFTPEPAAFVSSLGCVLAGVPPVLHPHWLPVSLSDVERAVLCALCRRLALACSSFVSDKTGTESIPRLLATAMSNAGATGTECKVLMEHAASLVPLRLREQRMKELEQVAPRVFLTGDFGYNGRHDPDQERRQAKLLLRKVKQEKRGAMRELRRDREFINNLKREEFVEETAERNVSLKSINKFLLAGHIEKKQEEKEKKKRADKMKL
jgi:hypothetical protein